MKNKYKIPQFPNIYRIITENKYVKQVSLFEFRLLNQSKHKQIAVYFLVIIISVIMIFLLFGSFILAVKTYQEVSSYSKIISKRQMLEDKISFWQSFTQKYDGYKDAYFQIALLEYQLGNFEKSREYNSKALLLDPGFDDAKNLGILLQTK